MSQHSYRAQPGFFTRICRPRLWLVALLCLTACGAQAPADQLAAALKPVTSWAATVHMLAEAWLAGAVPTAYATQTLEQGQRALRQQLRTLSSSSSPAKARLQVLEQVQTLQHTVGQMQAAIDHKDHAALAQQIEQLARAEHTLTALAKGGNAQP